MAFPVIITLAITVAWPPARPPFLTLTAASILWCRCLVVKSAKIKPMRILFLFHTPRLLDRRVQVGHAQHLMASRPRQATQDGSTDALPLLNRLSTRPDTRTAIRLTDRLLALAAGVLVGDWCVRHLPMGIARKWRTPVRGCRGARRVCSGESSNSAAMSRGERFSSVVLFLKCPARCRSPHPSRVRDPRTLST